MPLLSRLPLVALAALGVATAVLFYVPGKGSYVLYFTSEGDLPPPPLPLQIDLYNEKGNYVGSYVYNGTAWLTPDGKVASRVSVGPGWTAQVKPSGNRTARVYNCQPYTLFVSFNSAVNKSLEGPAGCGEVTQGGVYVKKWVDSQGRTCREVDYYVEYVFHPFYAAVGEAQWLGASLGRVFERYNFYIDVSDDFGTAAGSFQYAIQQYEVDIRVSTSGVATTRVVYQGGTSWDTGYKESFRLVVNASRSVLSVYRYSNGALSASQTVSYAPGEWVDFAVVSIYVYRGQAVCQ